MKLSDTEKKKNRTIAAGFTGLSISLLFLFFLLKNIVESQSNPLPLNNDSAGVEVQLGRPASSIPEKETEATVTKKEIPHEGNVVIDHKKNTSESISEQYKHAKTTSAATPADPLAETPGTSTLTTIGTDEIKAGKNNMVMVELGRRKVTAFPSLPSDMNQEGIVVVEIYVDKKGNVIEANPNGRGTNTSNSILRLKAKQIALGIKFSEDNRVEEQKGTVRINFKFE
jgi:hypothetical protein